MEEFGTVNPAPDDNEPADLAEQLGTDGPADTAQGLGVEADRDDADQQQAAEDEAARQEIEQGGG
jgi:hypothetical protein